MIKDPQQKLEKVGVTLYPEYILSEGTERVMEKLLETNIDMVATVPIVSIPSSEGQGTWHPPTDAGASVRRFDRQLWGKSALWMRSGLSFELNPKLYEGQKYRPMQSNGLAESHGPILNQFGKKLIDSGIDYYLQVGAAKPQDLSESDLPRLPDGSIPGKRLANIGCLASPNLQAFIGSYAKDLMDNYPELAGLRIDWPEIPCYTLSEAFQDFNEHVEAFANHRNFDFRKIKGSALTLWRRFHGELRNGDLERLLELETGSCKMANWWPDLEGLADWAKLKRLLSLNCIKVWREALDASGNKHVHLSANAFTPPFSDISGFDYLASSRYCQAVAPKLYTMHWVMIVEFWATEILGHNLDLDEGLLLQALCKLFGLDTPAENATVSDFHYPDPEEAHPVSTTVQCRMLERVSTQIGNDQIITPIVHGYGPVSDFQRRLTVPALSGFKSLWINRFGYLCDEKLYAIRQIKGG